jgi:hypothetical protein
LYFGELRLRRRIVTEDVPRGESGDGENDDAERHQDEAERTQHE